MSSGTPIRRFARFARRIVRPVADPVTVFSSIPRYMSYFLDLARYQALPGAEALKIGDYHPCLHDKVPTTPFDAHYFYQDTWAFRQIAKVRPSLHVDVGSRVDFVGFLATVLDRVIAADIRPPRINLANLECREASLLDLPFESHSIPSMSCLHVAEHVGLGRYGDALNPRGTRIAAAELSRVLAPGGALYFGVPIGRARVCFNSHRVHSVGQIVEYFAELKLDQFAAVDDDGVFHPNADPRDFDTADYACGLFRFTRVPKGVG